jgi:hypothetical protein
LFDYEFVKTGLQRRQLPICLAGSLDFGARIYGRILPLKEQLLS